MSIKIVTVPKYKIIELLENYKERFIKNNSIDYIYELMIISILSKNFIVMQWISENFKKEELNLKNELDRIEKLKLILESAELEKEIDNYNNQLNNFNDKIQKFNLHYEMQINNLKNRIVNIILEILKQYSEDNKIDLVLDSNNYVLSSNSINITDIIKDKANNKSIEINFEKY